MSRPAAIAAGAEEKRPKNPENCLVWEGHETLDRPDQENLIRGDSLGRRVEKCLKNKAFELPGQDSNLDKENQNLLCYRYTTG